jgi:hypothetical protein
MEGQVLNCKVGPGPNGDWDVFQKEKAGVLNLTKAGVQTLTVRPIKDKWGNGMNLRSVTLNIQ